VLLVHSWLRWGVLILGTAATIGAVRTWRSGEAPGEGEVRTQRIFLRVLDLQILLGVVLYGLLSPLPETAWADAGAAMGDGVLRFYAIEHPFGMLVGLVVAHVGLSRARRAGAGHPARTAALTLLAWLAVTVLSVPWPGFAYGRPLIRL